MFLSGFEAVSLVHNTLYGGPGAGGKTEKTFKNAGSPNVVQIMGLPNLANPHMLLMPAGGVCFPMSGWAVEFATWKGEGDDFENRLWFFIGGDDVMRWRSESLATGSGELPFAAFHLIIILTDSDQRRRLWPRAWAARTWLAYLVLMRVTTICRCRPRQETLFSFHGWHSILIKFTIWVIGIQDWRLPVNEKQFNTQFSFSWISDLLFNLVNILTVVVICRSMQSTFLAVFERLFPIKK